MPADIGQSAAGEQVAVDARPNGFDQGTNNCEAPDTISVRCATLLVASRRRIARDRDDAILRDFNEVSRQIVSSRTDRCDRRNEQFDLALAIDRRKNDQKSRVNIDKAVEAEEVAAVVGNKGEITPQDLREQRSVGRAAQTLLTDGCRLISVFMGDADQPRRHAFIEKETDQSLPSRSAQRRTASTPPSGRVG